MPTASPLNLAPWMMIEDGALPGGAIDMGVNLGGEDALVTEHLLNGAKIRAGLYQVSGKRMPESMGRNLLIDARRDSLSLNKIENRNAAERLAMDVKKKNIVTERPVSQVLIYRIQRRLSNWHKPLLVTLTNDAKKALLFENIRNPQGDSL